MTKWFIAFILFIGVFMTTRELMGNGYSSGDFQDFYIGFKNDLLEDIGVTTEVLGRDNDGIRRKNRILVLDLSNNENFSTVPFADSTAYFDLTGDGFKEKTSWIYAVDGILVLDKNHNGQIDGINEVFGKNAVGGLEELQKIADSNHDDIINKDDKLYSKLMIWQDRSQDGISQPSELKTLEQVGVEKIELNVLNFNVKAPFFHRSGRFIKNDGDEGLVYEARLMFDPRISIMETSMIPNYTVHHETEKLPKLRGYGTVLRSDIAYNANEYLRKLAFSMSKNIIDSERSFDQFIEEWSGFNALLRSIQKEYKLSSLPIVSETDKQIWILEAFSAADVNKHIIEQEIKTTANVMKTGGNPNVRALFYSNENTYVARQYKNLRDRYSAFFTLQLFYPNVMDGVRYDYSIDEFVIKDLKKFHKNVSNYFNSSKVSIESKLYLANNMHTLQGTFLHFNASEITKNIVDDEMKKIVSSVYDGSFTPVVYKAFNCGNGKGYMLYKQKVDGIYVKTKPYNISNSNNQKADNQCFTSSWLKIETLMVPSTKLSVAK
ncbi:hypothetical protein [Sulfuricurvum sp.]|uniref:hypothetical protein n=1 Tax=Sulfuricurvum sp. TaxID=2025608 RepID=UPI003BB4E081